VLCTVSRPWVTHCLACCPLWPLCCSACKTCPCFWAQWQELLEPANALSLLHNVASALR